MSHTPIARLMTTRVERVEPQCALADVVERMKRQHISCVVVCDHERPVGIISERDLVCSFAESIDGGSDRLGSAADLMSSPVITVGPNAPLAEALSAMHERGVRRLPVVGDDGRLVGIVTQTDLLHARSRDLEALHARLEANVARRTQELMEVVQRLETLSLQDGLLEIGNRRAMESTLDRVHETALRYERPYALLLFDVDHFKAYNDHHGHAAGDAALKRIAACLRGCLRAADSIYRYGGEEILAVLPETGRESARETAERLRAAVEALDIFHEGSPAGLLTVSCGVAAWDGHGEPPHRGWRALLENADRALYHAKDAGRNRVASADREPRAG